MAKTKTVRADVDNAAVVLFGQTWFVVANTTGETITREDAERKAIARFPFDGPPRKSNPSAVEAMRQATLATRRAVR